MMKNEGETHAVPEYVSPPRGPMVFEGNDIVVVSIGYFFSSSRMVA